MNTTNTKYLSLIYLILISLLITACSAGNDNAKQGIIEDEFKAVLSCFIQDGASYNVQVNIEGLSIIRGDLGDIAHKGECDKATKTVVINTKVTATEALMYHELAHCLLGLDHAEGTGHIMSEFSLTTSYYNINRGALVKDLFKNGK